MRACMRPRARPSRASISASRCGVVLGSPRSAISTMRSRVARRPHGGEVGGRAPAPGSGFSCSMVRRCSAWSIAAVADHQPVGLGGRGIAVLAHDHASVRGARGAGRRPGLPGRKPPAAPAAKGERRPSEIACPRARHRGSPFLRMKLRSSRTEVAERRHGNEALVISAALGPGVRTARCGRPRPWPAGRAPRPRRHRRPAGRSPRSRAGRPAKASSAPPPKITGGTNSGSTITAVSRPPRRAPRLSAAPIPPAKAKARPPTRAQAKISGASASGAPKRDGRDAARPAPAARRWPATGRGT